MHHNTLIWYLILRNKVPENNAHDPIIAHANEFPMLKFDTKAL